MVKVASLMGLEGGPKRSLFAYFAIMLLGKRG